jgi:hypothetical protein
MLCNQRGFLNVNMLVAAGLVILSLALLGAAVRLATHRRWWAATATGVAVLIVVGPVAFAWLSFGYPSTFLPIQAFVTPDRHYAVGGTMIPLPPRTVETGGCSATARWFYSHSPLADVADFYRTAGATVALAYQPDKASITYKGLLLEAAAISANETQLGIGCRVGN